MTIIILIISNNKDNNSKDKDCENEQKSYLIILFSNFLM